jgi:hypothetical protein
MGGIRHGIRFGEQSVRVLDALRHAGDEGIGYNELFEMIYAYRPSKRSALRGLVSQINRRLEESCVVQISGRGGRYHLTTLREKRMFQ